MARPKNWNIRLEELIKQIMDGSRKFNPEEDAWSRELEREIIRSKYSFPKKGQLYTCIQEHEIRFMTSWNTAFTGGGKSILKAGEQLWIDHEPSDPEPISVNALPVQYKSLEQRMVPKEDLEDDLYSGFYFHVSAESLGTLFELTDSNFSKNPYE